MLFIGFKYFEISSTGNSKKFLQSSIYKKLKHAEIKVAFYGSELHLGLGSWEHILIDFFHVLGQLEQFESS